MKHNTLFSVLLFTLLGTACGTPDATHKGHVPGAAELGNEHEGQAHAVQLNDGQPWVANTETTDGVNAMLALLQGYDPASGNGGVLKEELTAEFNEIFAKCTMTGTAHEQLHNYLTPVHAMLDTLGTKPTDADLSEISAYLKTYGNYFH